jgi:hypothetical protein
MSIPTVHKGICPACGRPVQHGTFQANYCVGFLAAEYLREHPRSSAWEISRGTHMDYVRVAAAMPKARDLNLVYIDFDEQLADGKRRYKFIAANLPEQHAELAERHRRAVSGVTRRETQATGGRP